MITLNYIKKKKLLTKRSKLKKCGIIFCGNKSTNKLKKNKFKHFNPINFTRYYNSHPSTDLYGNY